MTQNTTTDDPKSIPFITLNSHHKFELAEEAKSFLSSITSKKIGVISIAGKYRTGKSYFINKVLLNGYKFNGGFAVGHTVNACTKGLLIWNRLIPASDFGGDPNLDLLIVDTEGFDATDESANHNTRIFLLAVLLSSLFIFNSKLTIDERALESLEMVVKLAQNLKFKEFGEETAEEISKTFPSFLWVVRDFALEKKNEKGENITEKQYLEKALEEHKGFTDQAVNKNRIRKTIKKFFPKRDCMTFSRPAEREEDLRNLDNLPDSELRDKFLIEIRKAKEIIFKNVKTKQFGGNEVSGFMFYELCQALVYVINSGQIPNIEQIGISAYQECIRKSSDECLKLAEKLIIEGLKNGKMISDIRVEIEKTVLNLFKENSIGDKKLFKEGKQKLILVISNLLNKKQNEQANTLHQTIKSEFEIISQSFKNMIHSGEIGDVNSLKEEMDKYQIRVLEEYRFKPEIESFVHKIRVDCDKEMYFLLFEKQKEQERNKNRRMEEIHQNLEAFKNDNTRKNTEISDLKDQISILEEKIKSISIKNSTLFSEKENLEQKLKEQEKNAHFLKFETENRFIDLTHEMQKEIEGSSRKYQQELLQKEVEINNLKRDLAVKSATSESYKSELTKRDSDVEHLERIFDELKHEKKELTEKMSSSENKNQISDLRIKELTIKNENSERIITNLELSKQVLNDKIELLKFQYEDIKSLSDKLLINAGEKKSSNEGSAVGDLLLTNKNLSQTIKKLETTNKILEEQIKILKPFKKIFKNCENIQCRTCLKNIDRNFFLMHCKDCSENFGNRAISSNINNDKQEKNFNIKIDLSNGPPSLYVRIKESKPISLGKNSYMEYYLSVYNMDEKPWVLAKRYVDFSTLIKNLKKENPKFVFPKSCLTITGIDMGTDLTQIQKGFSGDSKKSLEDCINDLAKSPFIQKSESFKKFLNLEQTKIQQNVKQIEKSAEIKKSPKEMSDSLSDSGDDYLDSRSLDENEFENNNLSKKESPSEMMNKNKNEKSAQMNQISEMENILRGFNNMNSEVQLKKVNKTVTLYGKGFQN